MRRPRSTFCSGTTTRPRCRPGCTPTIWISSRSIRSGAPGALTLSGTPIDMGKVVADTYVVAGVTDHITPWKSVYQSARILGDETTFVLSNAGHLQSLINPPGNPKATFVTGKSNLVGPGGLCGGRGEAIGKLVAPLERMALDALGGQDVRRPLDWATPRSPRASRRRGPMCSMLEAAIPMQPRPHLRSTPRRSQDSAMIRRMMRVRGQDLWVVVKPGAKTRPPLLLFNGIGANAELAEPFMREMGDVETVIFDIPGVGRSPAPAAALSSLDGRAMGGGRGERAGIRSARRRRSFLGRRDGAAIRPSIPRTLPPTDLGRHRARGAHGSRQAVGSLEDGEPAALYGPQIYAVDRGGDLRRQVPPGPEPRRHARREHEGRHRISGTSINCSPSRDGPALRGFPG